MPADGEVEIQVKADGAQQAAQDAAEGSGTPVGQGAQQGGLSQSIRGGIIGGLLATSLQSILDVLSPMLKILNAFVAPVAILLLRTLQPVLRFMLQLLPAWYEFINSWMDEASRLGEILERVTILAAIIGMLPGWIWTKIKQGFSWIVDKVKDAVDVLRSLPSRIWSFLDSLPTMIGTAVASSLPGGNFARDVTQTGNDVVDTAQDFARDPGGTTIQLLGGLDAFVDRVERESGIDVPFI